MKVFINGTNEVQSVGSVSERMRNDGSCSLDININDSAQPLNEVKEQFVDITKVDIVRVDLNGEEQTVSYTDYTRLERIQRKIVDETDITTVTLVIALQAEKTIETETIENTKLQNK